MQHEHHIEQFYSDRKKINDLQETLLAAYAGFVKSKYNFSLSVRGWRILIGPYLIYISELTYFLHITGCIPEDSSNTDLYCLEIENFKCFDTLNSQGLIKKIITENSIETKKNFNKKRKKFNPKISHKIKFFLTKSFLLAQSVFRKRVNIFITESYLTKLEEIRLSKMVNDYAMYFPRTYFSTQLAVDKNLREQLFEHIKSVCISGDQRTIAKTFVEFLPLSHLESLHADKLKLKYIYPRHSEKLVTANAYNTNDCFKLYAALMCDAGSKLIIIQHGGHINTTKYCSMEDHQLLISDQFLSWGKSRHCKMTQVGNFRFKPIKRSRPLRSDPMLRCVIGLNSFNSNNLGYISMPTGTQCLKYVESMVELCKAISSIENLDVTVNFHQANYNDELTIFNEAVSRRLNLSMDALSSDLENADLNIVTSNTTTLNEAFLGDIPVLVYLDLSIWNLNEQAYQMFMMMKKVEILHDTPCTLKAFLSKDKNVLIEWWNSAEVQQVVTKFNSLYNGNPKSTKEFRNIFYKVLRNE